MNPSLILREAALVNAAKAVLLFHSSGEWTEQKKLEWFLLTQTSEATTKNLCDTIRKALNAEPNHHHERTMSPPTEQGPQ